MGGNPEVTHPSVIVWQYGLGLSDFKFIDIHGTISIDDVRYPMRGVDWEWCRTIYPSNHWDGTRPLVIVWQYGLGLSYFKFIDFHGTISIDDVRYPMIGLGMVRNYPSIIGR